MPAKENLNSFLRYLFGFKKTTGKFDLLLIILIHITAWCFFFLLPIFIYRIRIVDTEFLSKELVNKLVLVGYFYFHYYVLIPRFFQQRKITGYLLMLLVCFLLIYTQQLSIEGYSFKKFIRTPRETFQLVPIHKGETTPVNDTFELLKEFPARGPMSRRDMLMRIKEPHTFGLPNRLILMTLGNAISSFFLLTLMGSCIHLAFSLIKNQDEKRSLENAQLDAEVNFLKSQINPHFLFNTLNGIYSLAHAKSEQTEKAILKLSEMLRYMLYDSSIKKIELSRDIDYISNYIHLQRLRVSQKVHIDYQVKGNLQGLFIEPLLLITFIENPFKHGISYTKHSHIKIEINVFEETLTLLTSNPIAESNNFEVGGIGLKNARRRLDLLYPNTYSLDIVHNEQSYIVNLKISLKRD
ncbi:MAG: histidine kinase [Chitinophagaceae bacterium]